MFKTKINVGCYLFIEKKLRIAYTVENPVFSYSQVGSYILLSVKNLDEWVVFNTKLFFRKNKLFTLALNLGVITICCNFLNIVQ